MLSYTLLIRFRQFKNPHRHLLAVTAACPPWRTSGGPERTGSCRSKLTAPFPSPRCICDTERSSFWSKISSTELEEKSHKLVYKRVYYKTLLNCSSLNWSTHLLYSAPLKRLSGFLQTLHSMKRMTPLELRAVVRRGGAAVGLYLIRVYLKRWASARPLRSLTWRSRWWSCSPLHPGEGVGDSLTPAQWMRSHICGNTTTQISEAVDT